MIVKRETYVRQGVSLMFGLGNFRDEVLLSFESCMSRLFGLSKRILPSNKKFGQGHAIEYIKIETW